MCEPTTIMLAASLAISAATAVTSHQAQSATAKAQERGMKRQAAFDRNVAEVQMQEAANEAADAQNQRVQQARSEAALFDAIAGEFGGGVSVERMAAVGDQEVNRDLASIDRSRSQSLQQVGRESMGSSMRTQNGIASIERPSTLGTSLTIAGSAVNAYGTYRHMTRPQPKA